MRKSRHVQDLAPLGEEGSHIGTSVHGPSQDVRVILRGLGLADEPSEDAGKSDGLLHGAARRGRGQGLQVEGQVVLDGGARLNGLHLQRGADVGEHRRAERQRLRVVLLPTLVLGA